MKCLTGEVSILLCTFSFTNLKVLRSSLTLSSLHINILSQSLTSHPETQKEMHLMYLQCKAICVHFRECADSYYMRTAYLRRDIKTMKIPVELPSYNPHTEQN